MSVTSLVTGGIGPGSSAPLLLTGGIYQGSQVTEVVGGGWFNAPRKRTDFEIARESRQLREAEWEKRKRILALAAAWLD